MNWRNLIPPILSHAIDRATVIQPCYEEYSHALAACRSEAPEETIAAIVAHKTRIAIGRYHKTWRTKTLEPEFSQLQLAAAIVSHLSNPLILDFGGACGLHFFMLRAHLGADSSLSWAIIESPAMAAKAKQFQDEKLRVYTSIADALNTSKADLVYSSGTIAYTPDPIATLEDLARIGAADVLLCRTALTTHNRTITTIQKSRLKSHGYGSLPEGFTDARIESPLTLIPLAHTLELLKARYQRVTTAIESKSQHYTTAGAIDHYRIHASRPR